MVKSRKLLRRLSASKTFLLIVTFLILLIAGCVYFYINGHEKAVSGRIPSTTVDIPQNTPSSGTPNTPDSSNTPPSGNSTDNTKYSPPVTTNEGSLAEPSGTFISNHRPSLSGGDQQKQEQSTCSSTPGATCYIKFTQGGVVRTLTTQTIGASGTTFWSWNIDNSGLTAGTWQVTAVASLNGKIAMTNDSVNLEVQP